MNRCYLHYVQITIYTVSLISIENICLYDAIRDWKKVWQKACLNPGRPVKRHTGAQFTSCAIGISVLYWLCCSICHSSCTSWLTAISSSQRWVIYSQTNGAASNYTYLFRFVWFVVVFFDLLFCFRIYHCVFWLVIMFSELLLCFLIFCIFFRFAVAFVISYFVFRIVICFALLGHLIKPTHTQLEVKSFWGQGLTTHKRVQCFSFDWYLLLFEYEKLRTFQFTHFPSASQ